MSKFNILLVDDIENNLHVLNMIIEDSFSDINVLTALSAQEAVLKIMKYDIDLILSDVQMPEVNGFELIEYLSDIEQTRDIPIILITGIHDDIQSIQKGYDKGAIDYIAKPIEDGLLCSKLKVYQKIFEEKKKDKKLLAEKDELLLQQVKINSMINGLDKKHPKIKESLNSIDKERFMIDEEEKNFNNYFIKR